MLRLFVEYLIESAAADGRIAGPSLQALQSIGQRLGMAQVELEQMVKRRTQRTVAGNIQDPYETLGVTSSASKTEIKRAYRRLMSRHHPDKLIAKGLPKEMLDKAKEKTASITSAYEVIKNQHDW